MMYRSNVSSSLMSNLVLLSLGVHPKQMC